jgi:hypothetical protein
VVDGWVGAHIYTYKSLQSVTETDGGRAMGGRRRRPAPSRPRRPLPACLHIRQGPNQPLNASPNPLGHRLLHPSPALAPQFSPAPSAAAAPSGRGRRAPTARGRHGPRSTGNPSEYPLGPAQWPYGPAWRRWSVPAPRRGAPSVGPIEPHAGVKHQPHHITTHLGSWR